MSPILGIWASAQQNASIATSFDSISTITVGAGGSASITFSSIPSTYAHLQIRAISKDARSNANTAFSMRFNGDTASNYNEHGMTGDAGSVTAYATTNASAIGIGNTAGSTNANVYGIHIIDILDYANTNKFKTARILGGHDEFGSGSSILGLFSGAWRNTSAINSITILPLIANISQYSSFALYGIK
jgi:hypothetical protein